MPFGGGGGGGGCWDSQFQTDFENEGVLERF